MKQRGRFILSVVFSLCLVFTSIPNFCIISSAAAAPSTPSITGVQDGHVAQTVNANKGTGMSLMDSGLRFMPDEQTQKGLGYYMATLERGGTKTFAFHVSNVSNLEKSFYIYPSDILTGLKGGMEARGPKDKQVAVGSWFDQPAQQLVLKPGESKSFSFKLTVPKELDDGQYVGGVVIEPEATDGKSSEIAAADGKTATLQTLITQRSIIQTVVNVNESNAKVELTLPDPTYGYYENGRFYLNLAFKNNGTILQRPSGQYSLYDANNNLIESFPYSMVRVYGGTTGYYPYEPTKFLDTGTYTLKYNAKFADQDISKTFIFSITAKESHAAEKQLIDNGKMEAPVRDSNSVPLPWIIAGFSSLLLVIFLLLFLLLRRKKEKSEGKSIVQ